MCCGTEKIEIPSWVPVSGLQICPARVQFGGVGWLRRYGVGRNAECAKASGDRLEACSEPSPASQIIQICC